MGVIGYRVLGESPFFLSINVSMAGVLHTMVSCGGGGGGGLGVGGKN